LLGLHITKGNKTAVVAFYDTDYFFGGWMNWWMSTSEGEFAHGIHMQNLLET
jgi:hypothetical protein